MRSRSAKFQNNLLNVRNTDPVYKVLQKDILKHLPKHCKEVLKRVPQLAIVAADDYFLHYSVYPILASSNPDQILQRVLDIYREYTKSEDYMKAKVLTTLDRDLSMIHAIALTEAIVDEVIREMERQVGEMRRTKEGVRALQEATGFTADEMADLRDLQLLNALFDAARAGDQRAGQLLQKLVERGVQRAVEEIERQAEARRERGEAPDVFKVAERTAEEAKDLKDLMQGGRKAGKSGTSFELLLDLVSALKEAKMEDVLTLSRKAMESMPKFVHRIKERGKRGSELYGYRLTHRVEEALPRELALPDELFWYKMASGGLLAVEKCEAKEGAYYVLIDKSGSMGGEKTVWARSVALALYRLAKKKGRKYFLRFFDTEVYPRDEPISDPEKVVEHIVKVTSGGGTKIDHALEVALGDLRERKLSDYTNTIILITDGEDEVRTPIQALKECNATLVAIMIQGRNEDLEKLARESGGQYLHARLDARGVLRVVEAAGGR